MALVYLQPEVVNRYIEDEVVACKLAPSPALQLSPIGLIPKRNSPDKFQLIVDLSSQEEVVSTIV